jgi:L-ascorbate metabolism protein UlaG (beta-lactamase superfamily)
MMRACMAVLMVGLGSGSGLAELAFHFDQPAVTTNKELDLVLTAPAGRFATMQRSADAANWQGLVTLKTALTNRHTDGSAPWREQAFYRAVDLPGVDVFTGDHVATAEGDLVIHPVTHASFVMQWKGLTIYNDPDGAASLYTGLPKADLILVSHEHGDHFDAVTLTAVRKPESVILAPRNVFNQMSATLKAQTTVLTNGATTNWLGLSVEAVPAYNANHPKGAGNGYVVTAGGTRLYMSGDTGDIAEMRALPNIDVAFVCVNVPFTMTVAQAASAVRAFAPKVYYPYHFRNQDNSFSDLNALKRMIGTDRGVEVRIRKWY